MRKPDARDAGRVLALAVAAIAASWLVARSSLRGAGSAILELSFFAAPVLYAAASGLGAWKANGFRRVPLRKLGMVVVASLGTMWLLNGLVQIQTCAFQAAGEKVRGEAEEETRQIRESFREARTHGLAPTLGLLAIVPALCEETFFRGILLRGLASRFGFRIAIGITSVLFALLHQTLVQSGPMVLLGLYFGALVYLTGTLWSSILAHAVNNIAVVAVTWVYGTEMENVTGPWWMYPLSAAVVGLSLAWLALDRTAPTEE